jgi:hypothetical protein
MPTGVYVRTEAHRTNVSAAMTGRKRPDLSAALMGNTNSVGRVLPAETRTKISVAQIGNTNGSKGDDVRYGGAHDRIVAVRGKASEHSCVDCGGPARDWSLIHDAPDERIAASGCAAGLAYSLDVWAYEPRCAMCHKRYDQLAA